MMQRKRGNRGVINRIKLIIFKVRKLKANIFSGTEFRLRRLQHPLRDIDAGDLCMRIEIFDPLFISVQFL